MEHINRKMNQAIVDQMIADQHINPDVVQTYQSEISSFINEHFSCVPNQSKCNQAIKGYAVSLTFENGQFYLGLEPCAHTIKKQETQNYLNQFVLADFNPLETKSFLFTKTVNEQYKFYLLDENNPEDWAYISQFISSLEEFKVKKDLVKTFVEDLKHPQTAKGWYLTGPMGVGKTQLLRFLTVLAASKYQRQVVLTSTSYLINKVKASFGEVDSNSNAFLNQLAQVDILVLDDLGAEQVTPWVRDDLLFNLLNYRMENRKLTYFSSNLDWGQLKKHYNYQPNTFEPNKGLKTARLLERIETLSDPIILNGGDHRHPN